MFASCRGLPATLVLTRLSETRSRCTARITQHVYQKIKDFLEHVLWSGPICVNGGASWRQNCGKGGAQCGFPWNLRRTVCLRRMPFTMLIPFRVKNWHLRLCKGSIVHHSLISSLAKHGGQYMVWTQCWMFCGEGNIAITNTTTRNNFKDVEVGFPQIEVLILHQFLL